MQTDPASFKRSDVIAVWTERPRCPFTGEYVKIDLQHILGRGYKDGVGLKHEDRSLFSSILNCIPLHRSIHQSGYRDERYFRALCLDIARKRVQFAIVKGYYGLQEVDEMFGAFRNQWVEENNLPY